MRVLIVEDEEDIKEILNDYFELLNIEVDSSSLGKVALDFIEKNRYNLILTDLKLPDISGYEIIKKAKEVNPNVCICVLSGFTDDNTKNIAKNAGADIFIEKPFSFSKIEEVINKCNDR